MLRLNYINWGKINDNNNISLNCWNVGIVIRWCFRWSEIIFSSIIKLLFCKICFKVEWGYGLYWVSLGKNVVWYDYWWNYGVDKGWGWLKFW